MGDVCAERLRALSPPARAAALYAQLEPRLPRLCAGAGLARAQHAHHHRALLRRAAAVPAGGARPAPRSATARSAAGAGGASLRSAALLGAAAGTCGHRSLALSAGCRDPAPDGDVSRLGLAERLAAADSRPQPALRQSRRGRTARHRRWRLAVDHLALGPGARALPIQRGGRARHGVDLECHRQGQRLLGTASACRRGADRLFAQPSHPRGAAGQRAGRRAGTDLQQRPGHWPGRLV